ncbi:hypothetical protein ACFYNO_41085, partial [Kitasatospora sp. NPDC006697]
RRHGSTTQPSAGNPHHKPHSVTTVSLDLKSSGDELQFEAGVINGTTGGLLGAYDPNLPGLACQTGPFRVGNTIASVGGLIGGGGDDVPELPGEVPVVPKSGPANTEFGPDGPVTAPKAPEGMVWDPNNPELPQLRLDYFAEVEGLRTKVNEMREAGLSSEEIARVISQDRRDIGIKYKNLTPPDVLADIYARNKEEYGGDPLGPTVDFLRNVRNKTWDQIIEGALRPGGGDLGLGKR